MKKTLLILLACFMALAMQARTFVLIVGVSNYGDENNLSQTTKDAMAFKKVIETQTKDITTLTSKYATRANIREKLTAICNRAQKGDNIIFFYSGHGMEGGLYVYDGKFGYQELAELLDTSDASFKVCYIDACHSGTAADSFEGQSMGAPVGGKKDQAYIVGCRPDEYSFENSMTGGGFMTRALIAGLRGKSDTNADKAVTLMELFKYVHADVVRRSNGKQHPQLIAPERLYDVPVAKWK